MLQKLRVPTTSFVSGISKVTTYDCGNSAVSTVTALLFNDNMAQLKYLS